MKRDAAELLDRQPPCDDAAELMLLYDFRRAAAIEHRLLALEETVASGRVMRTVWLCRLARLLVRRPALGAPRVAIVAYLLRVEGGAER